MAKAVGGRRQGSGLLPHFIIVASLSLFMSSPAPVVHNQNNLDGCAAVSVCLAFFK